VGDNAALHLLRSDAQPFLHERGERLDGERLTVSSLTVS
jgi:hypothetical protein